MSKFEYLSWMAKNTPTQWCNDSALMKDLDAALASGAIGCTSNPPLTYEALTVETNLYADRVAAIAPNAQGDDRVVELLGVVVRNIASRLRGIHEASGKKVGYVRSQVQPKKSGNGAAMLRQGLKIASWGENVMVKVPGTFAGIQTLEELVADGIPTTATVCVSVSQVLAAAEAYERGAARARAAGRALAASTAALVMGRLQDYLTSINQQRSAGASAADLEIAALAVTKRCYAIMKQRGYAQTLMPAAFRAAHQVAGLVGAVAHMTIHPKIQAAIVKAEAEGVIQRKISMNDAVDSDAVARVARTLPEFTLAYEPEGLQRKSSTPSVRR